MRFGVPVAGEDVEGCHVALIDSGIVLFEVHRLVSFDGFDSDLRSLEVKHTSGNRCGFLSALRTHSSDREGLLKQLGSILEVMDAEMKRDGKVDNKKGLKQCRKLQGVLQDMDREATETLARKPLKLIHLNGCTDLRGCIQDPILPLYAPCPFIVCDHLGWIILLCLASPRHLVSCLYHNSSHPPLSLCPF